MTPPSGEHPSRTSRLPFLHPFSPTFDGISSARTRARSETISYLRYHEAPTCPSSRDAHLRSPSPSSGLLNRTSHPPHCISRPRHTLRKHSALAATLPELPLDDPGGGTENGGVGADPPHTPSPSHCHPRPLMCSAPDCIGLLRRAHRILRC